MKEINERWEDRVVFCFSSEVFFPLFLVSQSVLLIRVFWDFALSSVRLPQHPVHSIHAVLGLSSPQERSHFYSD